MNPTREQISADLLSVRQKSGAVDGWAHNEIIRDYDRIASYQNQLIQKLTIALRASEERIDRQQTAINAAIETMGACRRGAAYNDDMALLGAIGLLNQALAEPETKAAPSEPEDP